MNANVRERILFQMLLIFFSLSFHLIFPFREKNFRTDPRFQCFIILSHGGRIMMPSSRGAKANASSIRALRFSVLWFASSTLSRGAQPKANADFLTVIFPRPGPGEISEILERSATPRMHRKGRIQPARFFVPCVYAQDDSIRQLGDAESGRISRLGSFAPTLRRNDGLFQFSDFRTNTNSAVTPRFSTFYMTALAFGAICG